MPCCQADNFLTSQTRHHDGDENNEFLTTQKIMSSKTDQKFVKNLSKSLLFDKFFGEKMLKPRQKPVGLTRLKHFFPKNLVKWTAFWQVFDKLLISFWRHDFLGRQKLVVFVAIVVTGLARQKVVGLTTFWQVFGAQDFVCNDSFELVLKNTDIIGWMGWYIPFCHSNWSGRISVFQSQMQSLVFLKNFFDSFTETTQFTLK